jgi:hypothetical protein
MTTIRFSSVFLRVFASLREISPDYNAKLSKNAGFCCEGGLLRRAFAVSPALPVQNETEKSISPTAGRQGRAEPGSGLIWLKENKCKGKVIAVPASTA